MNKLIDWFWARVEAFPWAAVSYYSIFYLFLLIFLAILYPFSIEYASPVVSLIFPLDPGNSLPKLLIYFTVFFWGTVWIRIWQDRRRKEKDAQAEKEKQLKGKKRRGGLSSAMKKRQTTPEGPTDDNT